MVFYGFFFCLSFLSFFLLASSLFILYASFLDFFFGTDLGLDRLGFCFCTMFLVGRSVISFLASFHSLLGQFGLLTLGGFMSDAFFLFPLLFMGGLFFSVSCFVRCPVPLKIKRSGGRMGR